jgi:hypothetical protein
VDSEACLKQGTKPKKPTLHTGIQTPDQDSHGRLAGMVGDG